MATADEVIAHAAGWFWVPEGGEHLVDDMHIVRYPARFGGGVKCSKVDTDCSAAEVVDLAIAHARGWGEHSLRFSVSDIDRPSVEDELRRRGAEHTDTTAIMALALPALTTPVAAACPEPVEGPVEVPDDVHAVRVSTVEQMRGVDAVNVTVWGQQPLDEDGLAREVAEGDGMRVLAFVTSVTGPVEIPAATGGCTIVDGFLRLWGAASMPEFRGRGAYRAVLAERLRWGAERGAHTAIVTGRISTSAPILARAGFTRHGELREYTLEV
ncbi:MAG: hypothetical protein QM607_02935 [Microbacterium sp.]